MAPRSLPVFLLVSSACVPTAPTDFETPWISEAETCPPRTRMTMSRFCSAMI